MGCDWVASVTICLITIQGDLISTLEIEIQYIDKLGCDLSENLNFFLCKGVVSTLMTVCWYFLQFLRENYCIETSDTFVTIKKD